MFVCALLFLLGELPCVDAGVCACRHDVVAVLPLDGVDAVLVSVQDFDGAHWLGHGVDYDVGVKGARGH